MNMSNNFLEKSLIYMEQKNDTSKKLSAGAG